MSGAPWKKRRRTKLKALRHLVPEEVNRLVEGNRRRCPAIHKVGTDLAVPDERLGELVRAYRAGLAREGIPAVVFGHIGDNNLHVNMLPEDEGMLARAKALHLEWASLAVRLGGTIAAEHGVGKLKRQSDEGHVQPGSSGRDGRGQTGAGSGGYSRPGQRGIRAGLKAASTMRASRGR